MVSKEDKFKDYLNQKIKEFNSFLDFAERYLKEYEEDAKKYKEHYGITILTHLHNSHLPLISKALYNIGLYLKRGIEAGKLEVELSKDYISEDLIKRFLEGRNYELKKGQVKDLNNLAKRAKAIYKDYSKETQNDDFLDSWRDSF